MNHVGRTVMQKYGNTLRFGIVMSQKEENSWAHFRVKWIDDEAQEKAVAWRNKLTNRDYSREWYRVDSVLFIDPEEITKTMDKIQQYLSR